MFDSLLNAFRAPDIRRRLLYVLGILIVFRFLASVPVPGIDRTQLASFLNDNPIFGLLDMFSGGGLSQLSIVALGMNPYINASIIMQLMTGVIPSLQALSREGEYGRNRINQITRYLTVPLAALQAYGFLALLNAQGVLTSGFDLGNFVTITQIATLTAGAIVLMWLGELITEKGIGNGISFIIFAGIVSRAPGALTGFLDSPDLAQPPPRQVRLGQRRLQHVLGVCPIPHQQVRRAEQRRRARGDEEPELPLDDPVLGHPHLPPRRVHVPGAVQDAAGAGKGCTGEPG